MRIQPRRATGLPTYAQMTEGRATTSRPAASSSGTSPNLPGPSSTAAPELICGTKRPPVASGEATGIIADRWTVPEGIRERRRRKRAGNAGQAALHQPGNARRPPGPDRRGPAPRQPTHHL